MTFRTPRELIEIYWERVYNNLEVELVREVCADPIIRHDANFVTPLSHEEQIERIARNAPMRPYFTHRVLHADDRFVTSVWNMVSRDGKDLRLCGIEVFEAEGGRFIRCWNSTYMKGWWGEDGDLFDPAKLAPPALIDAPSQITADWIERAFAAGGVVTPMRIVTDPTPEPVGAGTSNSTYRVRLAYNAGHLTAPRSVVCKIGRSAEGGPSAVGPFERERNAYALFGPEPPFRTPTLYYGAGDGAGLSNLVLEDLTERARAGDQVAGCSIVEAAAVVRELARFHATYVGRKELHDLDWLARPASLLPAYHRGAAVLKEWLGARLPPGAIETIDGFGALAERWTQGRRPAVRTLIHCDPRVDNVLFEEAGGEVRACLIDWQLLSAGDPQYDVAYFLSGSLSPEERRACERELVAEHARLLARAEPGYSVEAALAAYRSNIVSGLWLTVVAAAHVSRTDAHARLLEVLVTRNIAAIHDWDGLTAP
jgi:hypothetical protein